MNAYHNLVYFLISVTPLLISTWAFLVYWSEYLASFLEPDPATLRPDYIIVGGGAAGAAVRGPGRGGGGGGGGGRTRLAHRRARAHTQSPARGVRLETGTVLKNRQHNRHCAVVRF